MEWWSVARYDLQLSDNEFWALTPAQYLALVDRFEEDLKRADYRAGIIATVLAQAHGSKEAKPETFFATLGSREELEPVEEVFGYEAMLAQVEFLNAQMHGVDLRQ